MKLELQNITGGYLKDQDIIRNINLTVLPGESVSVIGQNGAGKSTIAKVILGMLPYFSGKVIFNGTDMSRKNTSEIIKSGIGYFMQGGEVFPHLSTYENLIMAGNELKRKDLENQVEKLSKYFTFLHKKELKKEAGYLSGGLRHQLALAMVLIRNPKFLILDEPSAGLSPALMSETYEILIKLKQERKLGIILIEQNVTRAIEFSERIVLIKSGEIEENFESNNSLSIGEVSNLFF